MAAPQRVRSSVWKKRILSELDSPHLLELGDHDVGFDPDLEYPAGGRLDETFQGGMFPQVQAEDLFSRPNLDLLDPAQSGHGDAPVEVRGDISAVVEEHGDLGKTDKVGVLPGVHARGEVDALEVLGYREGHEILIGRAGLPGGQNAELLAGEKPPYDGPGVQVHSRFHPFIFDESRLFVNGKPALDQTVLVD